VTAASDLPAPAAELRRLADDLDVAVPPIDQELVQEIERRRAAQAAVPAPVATVPSLPGSPAVAPSTGASGVGGGRSRNPVVIGAGAVLILVGAVLAVLGQIIAGGAVAVAGVALTAAGLLLGANRRQSQSSPPAGYLPAPPPPPPPPPPDAELPRLEARLLVQEEASAQARQRREGAVARVLQLALPAESTRLRALSADAESAATADARHAEWLERRDQLVTAVSSAAEQMRGELAAQGVPVAGHDDLDGAYERYVTETQQRAEAARRTARRPDLEARLAGRRAAESARDQELVMRAAAERNLLDAATGAGCSAPTPDDAATALRAWRGWAEQQAEARQEQAQARARLDQLLGGQTIGELDADIEQLLQAAGERPPADAPALQDRSAEVREIEGRAVDQRESAAELAGQVEAAEKYLSDVSAAIEAEARADAEVGRIERLADDLDHAARVLESAQRKVHADIAPVLNDTIRPWVPRITQGRYDDIRVDPATLEVQAHEAAGQFRTATVLSHGTTEQLFLLLRLALAEHLATTGESAPVVLDDVTVQSDTQRTIAILDLLLDISRVRQVVLFSQEDEVVRWAEEALEQPSDRLIRLGRPSTPG